MEKPKVKDKERILKAAREKQLVTYMHDPWTQTKSGDCLREWRVLGGHGGGGEDQNNYDGIINKV